MSDVEILGRPLYRPVKHRLQESGNPLVQSKSNESKKTHLNIDVVYERDEGDWWWCEDVDSITKIKPPKKYLIK